MSIFPAPLLQSNPSTRPGLAVQVLTPFGEMLLPAHCKFVTPAVQENGLWAPDECLMLQTLIRKGDVVLDVGAHAGYLTLVASRAAGESGQVISLEPTPQTAEMLRANVANLALAPVEVVEAAAWSENSTAELSVSTSNSGDNRAYLLQDQDHQQTIPIQRFALDQLLSDLPRLNVVKIDTQGSELHVLLGMTELLKKFKPTLIMEFWPEGLAQNDSNPQQLLDLLRGLDYQLRVPGAYAYDDAPYTFIEEMVDINPGKHISLLCAPEIS